MTELKYTWRVQANDQTQALLKMRALTLLSNKLEAREIELLSRSKCLPYFIECANRESEEQVIVPPLSKQEEKLILRRRRRRAWLAKFLPFIKPEERYPGKNSQWTYNGQTKTL